MNTVHLNHVIVGFGTGSAEICNELTRATVEQITRDNICLAGGADWRGRFVLRLSLIAASLTESDIDRLAAAISSAWRDVRNRTA